MKATLKIEAIVSTDDDQKNLLWKEDDDTLNTVVRTDVTVQSSGVATVAASASFSVPFGDVTTGYILKLTSDAEITVIFNGGAETITVKGTAAYRGLLALHGEFTQIDLTAVAAANVRYCVVGV